MGSLLGSGSAPLRRGAERDDLQLPAGAAPASPLQAGGGEVRLRRRSAIVGRVRTLSRGSRRAPSGDGPPSVGIAPEGWKAAYSVGAGLCVATSWDSSHAQGYAVGSFQPLQEVAHPVSTADRIPGLHIAVIGSPVGRATPRLGDGLTDGHCARFTAPALPRGHGPPVELSSPASRPGGPLHGAGRGDERRGSPGAPPSRPWDADEHRGARTRGVGTRPGTPRSSPSEPEDRGLYTVFEKELLRLVGSNLPDESRHESYEQFEKNR